MVDSITRVAAPLRQQIVAQIRASIVRQDYVAGDRLVERVLCERFDASRTVVREALRELEGEGLVATIPNRGSVVATLTAKEAMDLYDVRGALEALIGRLFTLRASDGDVEALTVQLSVTESALRSDDLMAALEEKDRFYGILMAGAANRFAADDLSSLHARISLLRAITLGAANRTEQTIQELRDILGAIRNRDADRVAVLCQSHVDAAQAVALRALSGDDNTEEVVP